MELKKLLARAKRHAEEAAELAGLDRHEANLRLASEEHMAKLNGAGGAALLVKTAGREVDLPEDVKIPLLDLKSTTLKLSMMPGVRKNLTETVARLESEIEAGTRELRADYWAKARAKVSGLQGEIMKCSLEWCGGDVARAREATKFIVAISEAQRWAEFFRGGQMWGDSMLEAVEHLAVRIERFEGGKPLSEPRK